MSLACHRRSWTVAAAALAWVLVALVVVNGCAKLTEKSRAQAPAAGGDPAAAPTTQPSETAEAVTETADATTQPSEPTTQAADAAPTTQPATAPAVADVSPSATEPAPATQPA